jgi:hypothetical protein
MQPHGPSGTATSESDSSTSWATSAVKPLCYCERPACVLTSYTKKISVEGFENARIIRYNSKTLINCKFIWWGCCRFSLFWKLWFRLCPLLKWAVFMTFGFGNLIRFYCFAWFWNNVKQFFHEFLSKGNKNSNTHTRCMMKCLNQSAELWEAWWRFLKNTELLMHCSSVFC